MVRQFAELLGAFLLVMVAGGLLTALVMLIRMYEPRRVK